MLRGVIKDFSSLTPVKELTWTNKYLGVFTVNKLGTLIDTNLSMGTGRRLHGRN